jgi:hypothetical protein
MYEVESFCRKGKKVAAYLLAEVPKLGGIGRKLDKGSFRLCLGKKTFKPICWSIDKEDNREVNTRIKSGWKRVMQAIGKCKNFTNKLYVSNLGS